MKLPEWADSIQFVTDEKSRELSVELCAWRRGAHLMVSVSAESFNIENLKIMLQNLARSIINCEFPDLMPGFYTRQAKAVIANEPLHPTDAKLLARMNALKLPDSWPNDTGT
jgi:hypothetical protein